MLQDCEFVDTDKLIVTNMLCKTSYVWKQPHLFTQSLFQMFLVVTIAPNKEMQANKCCFFKKICSQKVPMPAMSRLASVTSLFNNVKCFNSIYCKLKEKYPIRRKVNSKKKCLYVKSALLFLGFPKIRLGLACATKNQVAMEFLKDRMY